MRALVILLTTTVAVVIGRAPAFLHSHQVRNVNQRYGQCSLDDIDRLFQGYPQECSAAYESLSDALRSEDIDRARVAAAYSTICSSACKNPVLSFRETCQERQLTDRIIHACAETSQQSTCIVELFRNNGTEVVAKCRSVGATGSCNEECRSAVMRFKTDLGCCVNSLFNVSTYGFQIMNVTDYRLWSVCGVDTPEICEGDIALLQLRSSAAKPYYTFLPIFGALLVMTAFMLTA